MVDGNFQAEAQTQEQVQSILEEVIRQYSYVYNNVNLIVAVISTLFKDVPYSDQIELDFKFVILLMNGYQKQGIEDPITRIRHDGSEKYRSAVNHINKTLTTAAGLIFAHRKTQQ